MQEQGARAVRRSFLVGSAAAFASVNLVRAPSRAAQFEFKCASNQPFEHPLTVRLGQMWAAVERESGGRIHIQFFPNSLLGGDAAMFSQLRVGAIQFLQMTPAALSSVVPAADIAYLGFAFKDADDALRVMDGPVGGYVRQEATTKNVHVLTTMWDSGMLEISTGSHPIRTPDDMRGLKVRVTESRILFDLFKVLGANPTTLSFSEVYTALQTKVVDAQVSALGTMVTSKFYEVQKYLSLTNHAYSGQWMVANGEVWKSLPPDLQDVVERNCTKYGKLERLDVKKINVSVIEQLTKLGITVNRVDQTPFRAPLKPYYQQWANTFGTTEWGLLQTAIGRTLV